MPDSLADWLALREPVDVDSRSGELTRALLDVLPDRAPLRIIDLGSGTGANVRYLAARLRRPQEWLVVDRDPGLLSRVQPPSGCRLETLAENLAALRPDWFAGRQLVTASALLDLVSARWLETVADACRTANAVALFALTYNGRSSCSPPEPEDEIVRELMNRHQRQNDVGTGRAAGPGATDAAARAFAAVGYRVRRETSDWNLSPETHALQQRLIEGWATAAIEMAPDRSATLCAWLDRRLAHVRSNRSHIVVGHEDLMAWSGA